MGLGAAQRQQGALAAQPGRRVTRRSTPSSTRRSPRCVCYCISSVLGTLNKVLETRGAMPCVSEEEHTKFI